MGVYRIFRWMGVWLILFALSTSARADGGFIGRSGDIAEPEQKAAILFSGGVEELIIQVQYDGDVDDFAWLVPLPSKPEVSVVEEELFAELRSYVYERSKARVYRSSARDEYFGAFGGGATRGGGVTVHEYKKVGVYEVAILEADSVDELVGWCDQYEYNVSPTAHEVLKSYVDRNWVFTAMRIHPKERNNLERTKDLHRGEIQAMRFRFPTTEAVYPLRISSINRGATDVLVYVLANDVLIHPGLSQRHHPSFEEFRLHQFEAAAHGPSTLGTRFAKHFDARRASYRPVQASELPSTRKAFSRWGSVPLCLTALQQTFDPTRWTTI